jgi:hypothetical protein
VSYTEAVRDMTARQDEALALLHALHQASDAHTALLVAVLVLSVGLALAVGVLTLLAREWSRRALADHADLMREARRPTPEQEGLSHAISDMDDAVRALADTAAATAETRDELRNLRVLAEAYLGRFAGATDPEGI